MNHTHLPNSVIGVILQRVCDHKELDGWIKSDHGNELHGSISMIKIERETTQRMKKPAAGSPSLMAPTPALSLKTVIKLFDFGVSKECDPATPMTGECGQAL